MPPNSNDGVPAPISAFTPPESRAASRATVNELLAIEWAAGDGRVARGGSARLGESRPLWHAAEMRFYGPSGVGLARSYDEYVAHVLGPIWAAFADRRFEVDVISCEGAYCGAHGHLVGTHVGCYLGEWPRGEQSPPAESAGGPEVRSAGEEGVGRSVRMRLGLHWHVVDGQVLDGYMMHDAPALFRDAFGVDLLSRASSNEPLPPACPSSELVTIAETAVVPKEVQVDPLAGHGALAAAGVIIVAMAVGAIHIAMRWRGSWRRGPAPLRLGEPLLEGHLQQSDH